MTAVKTSFKLVSRKMHPNDSLIQVGDVVLYGYNASIVRHGESDRLMKIDFYSRKPLNVSYQLLEGK